MFAEAVVYSVNRMIIKESVAGPFYVQIKSCDVLKPLVLYISFQVGVFHIMFC